MPSLTDADEAMLKKIEQGFVFLDDKSDPYYLKWWGNSPWLFYWHVGKTWVSLRPADWENIAEMLSRALPPEEADLYHKLHAKHG